MYKAHLFICTNKREDGKDCCANKGSIALRDRLKAKSKSLDGVRVNASGCLGQCSRGIAAVLYPQGEWKLNLTASDEDSLMELLKKHSQQAR